MEISLSERIGLPFDFSKYTLYFLVGEQFRGNISEFQALGIRVVIGSELIILKTPVHGTAIFGKIFHAAMATKIRELSERKRRDRQTAMRCQEQGLGFEPLVFEIAGGLDPEGDHILSSLCRAVDDHHQKPHGVTCQILKECLSFMLQRHAHVCLWRVRDGDDNREKAERHHSSSRFVQYHFDG